MTRHPPPSSPDNEQRVIVHAINIHQGGGATLLRALLGALNGPALAFLDDRMTPLPATPDDVNVVRVKPRLLHRLIAESQLRKRCEPHDIVLCFGNLPPLWRCNGRVYVYLQNRYLVASRSLMGLPLKAQFRIRMERVWLRALLRNATLVVQTESMAAEVRQHLAKDCEILPFGPGNSATPETAATQHDFVYVASGEPHKNHRLLLEAWEILAARGLRPSLCLTLDESADAGLLDWIRRCQARSRLQIHNQKCSPGEISALYQQSRALIYPSLFESFGLPLLEAQDSGLPILASERDYVRDVVEPAATFDPDSPLSIARAIMRHLGKGQRPADILSAADFWEKLKGLHLNASAADYAALPCSKF